MSDPAGLPVRVGDSALAAPATLRWAFPPDGSGGGECAMTTATRAPAASSSVEAADDSTDDSVAAGPLLPARMPRRSEAAVVGLNFRLAGSAADSDTRWRWLVPVRLLLAVMAALPVPVPVVLVPVESRWRLEAAAWDIWVGEI